MVSDQWLVERWRVERLGVEGWKIGRMEEAEDEKTGNGRAAVASKEGYRKRILWKRDLGK